MITTNLRRWAKWFWIACVFVAAAWFVHRSWPDLQRGLSGMPVPMIVGSLLLTVVAKFALGENARLAATRCGINLPYGTMLRLYNLSQLGKYLPGSIWQYVGRAAAYRNRGAAYGAIRDSLLTETLWVVASASLIGVALVGSHAGELLRASASVAVLYWLGSLLLAGLIVLLLLLVWRRNLLRRYALLLWPGPRLVLVQLFTWTVLGFAFWLLAIAAQLQVGLIYATGLFALAFAMGFLVPIAPAGLGIRDGILTLGLIPFGALGDALAVAVVARLVYLVAEVGLVAAQELVMLVVDRQNASAR